MAFSDPQLERLSDYQTALPSYRKRQPSIWSAGESQELHPESGQFAKLALAGGIGFGAFMSGFIPTKSGRMWDYYLAGIRAVEDFSPGGILRTFQLSNILGQFTTESMRNIYISPHALEQIGKSTAGQRWIDFLAENVVKQEGITPAAIRAHGLYFQGGKYAGSLHLATTAGGAGQTILPYASVFRSPTPFLDPLTGKTIQGASTIAAASTEKASVGAVVNKFVESAYRHMGAVPGDQPTIRHELAAMGAWGRVSPKQVIGGETIEAPLHFIGGQTPWKHVKRQVGGIFTEAIERFNRLARRPWEWLPEASQMQQITSAGIKGPSLLERLGLNTFGVRPRGAIETQARLVGKIGLVGGAAYLGYQTADWAVRNTSLLDNTIFEEGITSAGARVLAGAHIASAKVADILGLQEYARSQEEVAPGSTDLLRLAGFPLAGALSGAFYHWGRGIAERLSFMKGRLGEGGPGLNNAIRDATYWYTQRMSEPTGGLLGKIGQKLATNRIGRAIVGAEINPLRMRTLAGAALGLLPVLPFIPGALIPQTPAEELGRIYSGQQEVPIMKNRWWTSGRQPFEGTEIGYFRPHMLAMLSKGRSPADIDIWGEDEPSPISKWFQENFTYNVETKHYYDRPYPLSGQAFSEIPLIGPLLSSTIGRVVKPPLLMHESEFMRRATGGETEYLHGPPGFGELRALDKGELPPGAPIDPNALSQTIGEQIYRTTEQIGLWGHELENIKELITGEREWFDQQARLQSASTMYGATRAYWDMELGDPFGITEFQRRLIPHRRKQIEEYNPLRNQMPDWLPGSAERGPDLLHGDPYSKVPFGEARLPGPGFASIHPELEGVDPTNYPAVWRHKILGDVAPYSTQYDIAAREARGQLARGELSSKEEAIFRESLRQMAQRRKGRQFMERTYSDKSAEDLAAINTQIAESPGIWNRLQEYTGIGSYWETLSHGAEDIPFIAAMEQFTPLSPLAKLTHMRTAIEDYQRTQLTGTEMSMWQKPIEHFIKPTIYAGAETLGYEGIPSHIQAQRELRDYFDALKYIKLTRLKEAAVVQDDQQAASEFESLRRETLTGVNPYTQAYTQIYRSLPGSERDYFRSFAEADTPEERQKILEMIPENQRALYQARWEMQDRQELQKKLKEGTLTGDAADEAKKDIEASYAKQRFEGFPFDEELWEAYLAERLKGESYADWYRRTRILPAKLAGRALPGPDYAGWYPHIDMKDIQIKVIENLGEDIHNFNLWKNQQRQLAYRPYIEEIAEELEEGAPLSREEIRARIHDILADEGLKNVDIYIRYMDSEDPGSIVDMDVEYDIRPELSKMIRESSFEE